MKISDLTGVGPKKIVDLKRMGIISPSDLLTYFPRAYEDRTKMNSISDCTKTEEEIVVKVKITDFHFIYPRSKKRRILKVKVTDSYVNASLICFNREYLKEYFEKDKEYIIIGKFEFKYNEFQSTKFEIAKPDDENINYNRIVPVYPLVEGVSQNFIRKIMHQALQIFVSPGKESLPDEIINKRKLANRNSTIKNIHFPESFEALEKARLRLKYYELFELQLILALQKHVIHKRQKNRKLSTSKLKNSLIENLVFDLTNDQVNAINEIETDLLSEHPMTRLLLGDVGAGKTLVALLTACTVLDNGFQVAMMAPTEILAKQHFQTVKKLFDKLPFNIGLLYSGLDTKEKAKILQDLASGEINFIIGTHSLFQDGVKFKSLSYVIIDEQHRFGVKQRLELMLKGDDPDLLVMTATPIPRSLSLTVFGDLDVSIIKEKPAKRLQIKTSFLTENRLNEVFNFTKKEIQKGHKAYIVYPVIEDSEKLNLKSAISMYEQISEIHFHDINCGLIHGRMHQIDKEETMENFKNGKIQVLVSTTVIEVGVDIPDATVMIIENAHRYGLSTLHQLRGRIGRSDLQSYCFLVAPNDINDESKDRLNIITSTDDGFQIAEQDLKLRGPGQFLGTRQHGTGIFKLASLVEDQEILLNARADAFEIVSADPELSKEENSMLKNSIYKKFLNEYKNIIRS